MRLAAVLLAALLAAGALTACAGGEAAQGPLLLTAAGEQAANERTVRVERGTLVQEFRASASVQSVREVTVYLEAEDAQFVEHRVQNGQRVEAGDVLSVFRKRSDNVRLAEIEVELQGLAAEREDGLYDRDKADEDLRKQLYELEILPSRVVALSGTVGTVWLKELYLSELGPSLLFEQEAESVLQYQPFAVYLADGTVCFPRWEGGGGFGRTADGSGIDARVLECWAFQEPVDPEEVVGISFAYWYIPIAGDTAGPGYWLAELPQAPGAELP